MQIFYEGRLPGFEEMGVTGYRSDLSPLFLLFVQIVMVNSDYLSRITLYAFRAKVRCLRRLY
jgi:hypothetical protein